jgi:hypothetical protein
MTSQGKFMIFCAEQYRRAKQLSGRQLSDLFDKYRVWNYLYDCYEALHTTGTSYIIEDIDLYIDARKPTTV